MELAPNGLPYEACPAASNEWSLRSPLLARLPADVAGTVHPSIVARPRSDVGGGMGLFATFGLAKGEVVWAERAKAGPQVTAIPRSRAWIDALPPASKKAYCHFMYKTGDDEYQSLAEFNHVPIDDFPKVRTLDVSNYMNHSCEPTCWFVQGGPEYTGLMVAARPILPGEEITYDYATSEDDDLQPSWECHCYSDTCRGFITPSDWTNLKLQKKYKGHFLPHIAARIAESHAGPAEPLETIQPNDDGRGGWWLHLNQSEAAGIGPSQQPNVLALLEPDRKALLRQAAAGDALELLNRQAAILISHWRLRMQNSPSVGRYLEAGEAIPAGELVMLLPPNLLLWDEEVPDFNMVLQISTTPSGARLFSSSLTPNDLDNFLCHSCEPNCEVIIGSDLAAALRAVKPIALGDSITFDYDTTEDDLRDERGGFACQCGAPLCRRIIAGRLYSPNPPHPSPDACHDDGDFMPPLAMAPPEEPLPHKG